MAKNNESAKRDFVITRTFAAPRDLVWAAFTDPEHMKNWWGPKGFTPKIQKMDFRPGGSYHYCQRSPDGTEMWGKFEYKEIKAPEKIVFINSFSDAAGDLTRHPMNANWPLRMLSTVTLEEQGGKTVFTVSWLPYEATEEEWQTFEAGRADMQQGWTGTFDQLEEYLAKAKA